MSGDHKLFIILLGITVVLLLASVVSVLFVLEAHDRENKFKSRVQEAVAPTARHPNPVE